LSSGEPVEDPAQHLTVLAPDSRYLGLDVVAILMDVRGESPTAIVFWSAEVAKAAHKRVSARSDATSRSSASTRASRPMRRAYISGSDTSAAFG